MTSASGTERWFGLGYSTAEDPGTAGAEAVAAALQGRQAVLLLVFCGIEYDCHPLLDAVCAGAGRDVAIAGCSTDGQVAGPGPYQGPGGALVIAFGGAGFSVRTSVARQACTRQREAGLTAAGCMDGITAAHRVCLLLADGGMSEQHELVRGAYAALGAGTPLVGGCAADEMSRGRPYQFHGDEHGAEVLTDAVVGIGLGSDAPCGIGIAHGWRTSDEPMVVTDSSGGHLRELDGEPAFDVYMRRLGRAQGLVPDPEVFDSLVLTWPLGLSRRSGEDIRLVHRGDPATGSLSCHCDIPQGALAWVMESDPESLVLGAKDSVAQAVAGLGGADPIGLLVFDCGARRALLGDETLEQEHTAMAAVAGDVPFGGFYTFGEIARTHGARGLHHLTVVTLAIG